MEEENQLDLILQDNQRLAEQLLYLGDENSKLSAKLNIALQGLEALYSGGEPTGLARKTLEEIKNTDLPQE